MSVDIGKCAPGMDRLSSIINRVHMELVSKFLNPLRMKTLST